MALVVGTDSYIDLTFADTYHGNFGNDAWGGVSDANKEVAIRKATRYLDDNFKWVGTLSDATQKLGWPRLEAYDNEGRELVGIPEKLQQATADLALYALTSDLLPMETKRLAKKVKAGAVEKEYSDTSFYNRFETLTQLLRGIGTINNKPSSFGVVKLVRG